MKTHHLAGLLCLLLAVLLYVLGTAVHGAGILLLLGAVAELWGWYEMWKKEPE